MKVEEEGMAFHTENQTPPTVAILDLGCTRAMGSRNAINAFCDYVDKHDYGLWYKIEPTSSRFFFANSQQTKCTEKLVIHMYDKEWSVHTTEFDIGEEGNVPLLMSLPQMRNLGFQFELSPQQSFLNCTRLGMWKHKLRMSKSTHLVMDFQDIAWYMSAVYFKTPEVRSFFSQSEHFEYSQLSVETFAFATDDDWEIDSDQSLAIPVVFDVDNVLVNAEWAGYHNVFCQNDRATTSRQPLTLIQKWLYLGFCCN